jgi:transcriptional regulator with XRE-family HTH domain
VTFGEKLSFLIKHFNSSNSKLAKAITVDPSLVSKWVNGRRVPPLNSPYIIQIAEYFIRIPAGEYQQPSLLNLLKEEFPELNPDIFDDCVTALIKWLTSQVASEQSNMNPSIGNMPGRSLESHTGFMGHSAGETGYYEFFGGRQGRRQAVINFLQAVLDASEPTELLLASQEDIKWIVEDAEFLSQWARMLQEILSRGHRIIIIHTVNRDISQIGAMFNYWIPLHLTGKVESYYYPKYEHPALIKTVFVARGIAAILSIVPAQGSDAEYTFQFQDSLVIGLMEQNFQSYLQECLPLVKSFSGDRILDLYNEVIEAKKKPGYFYTLRNDLNSLTMSVNQFSRLIEQSSLTSEEKNERIELHKLCSEAFLQTIQYNRFREICPMEAINLQMSENRCMAGSELLPMESVKLAPEDLQEHLSYIISLLENHENYELILYNNKSPLMPSNISLTFKQDYYAIMSSCDNNPNPPYALLTSEGNILQALEEYFENIYQQIPANNRNKTWVINKLKSRIIAVPLP